ERFDRERRRLGVDVDQPALERRARGTMADLAEREDRLAPYLGRRVVEQRQQVAYRRRVLQPPDRECGPGADRGIRIAEVALECAVVVAAAVFGDRDRPPRRLRRYARGLRECF